MTHTTAIKQNLEPVYPEIHHLGQQVFYDKYEGKYYDSSTDLYLEPTDCRVPFYEFSRFKMVSDRNFKRVER
jgi:hypothetical protein